MNMLRVAVIIATLGALAVALWITSRVGSLAKRGYPEEIEGAIIAANFADAASPCIITIYPAYSASPTYAPVIARGKVVSRGNRFTARLEFAPDTPEASISY